MEEACGRPSGRAATKGTPSFNLQGGSFEARILPSPLVYTPSDSMRVSLWVSVAHWRLGDAPLRAPALQLVRQNPEKEFKDGVDLAAFVT